MHTKENMFRLSAKLFFEDSNFAKNVAKLLKVDLDYKLFRSKSTISLQRKVLSIKISAEDLTAIRAAINYYMKSIILIEELNTLNQ